MVGWLYSNTNKVQNKVVKEFKNKNGDLTPIWGFDGSSTERKMVIVLIVF